jgi:hypothetical protein
MLISFLEEGSDGEPSLMDQYLGVDSDVDIDEYFREYEEPFERQGRTRDYESDGYEDEHDARFGRGYDP